MFTMYSRITPAETKMPAAIARLALAGFFVVAMRKLNVTIRDMQKPNVTALTTTTISCLDEEEGGDSRRAEARGAYENTKKWSRFLLRVNRVMCTAARAAKMPMNTADTAMSVVPCGWPPKVATRGGYGGPAARKAA